MNFWSQPLDQLYQQLETTRQGLTAAQAEEKLKIVGLNTVTQHKNRSTLNLFLRQFKEPLMLILIFAVIVSAFAGEWVDAGAVILVVIGSAVLTFIQEYRATNAVEKLLARVQIKATVLRDGQSVALPIERVVPGDIALLAAGNLIPGDGLILDAKDCYVDQAVLTGETFPVEKMPGLVAETASLAERANTLFMGTHIRSGTATLLVVQTGTSTAFGQIAERLTLRPPETEFERGIRKFGYLLIQIILVLVLFVFAVNVFAAKPPVDSLLFAIALAVGVAPELLPAVITITLSRGAQQMADQGVIVRRLNAIENFGNMDVLCTDKTGTLTEGRIDLQDALDVDGQPSADVFRDAYLNAHFQVGIANPLDEAIVAGFSESDQVSTIRRGTMNRALLEAGIEAYRKIDEIPYDFTRKRLTIVVEDAQGQRWLITKGALDNVLDVCARIATSPSNRVRVSEFREGEKYRAADSLPSPLGGEGSGVRTSHSVGSGVRTSHSEGLLDSARRAAIQRQYEAWSAQGLRVIGLATKPVDQQDSFTRADERDLIFRGFLLFVDPPKAGVRETLANLAQLGVQLKIITGDNRQVTRYIAQQVGLSVTDMLTGSELNELRDEALWQRAERANLFVEVDPNQKERIIRTLQKMGHVVGYMGDGINDAPALHVADVGISVDQAVDVAKEAADFVLVAHSLDILRTGIINGRKTFANTLKYVFTTTSANFGNMFSMAGLSAFLPFLPLLAKQILLNNFLSDFPGMAIAGDAVDPEWIQSPHRWDVKFIRNFMIVFGLVSSAFDYLTFAVLLWVVHAAEDEFRTAWFIESLMTELVIALVVRTRRPFFRSTPGRWLWLSTLAVAIVTVLLPYLPPVNTLFGLVPLPAPVMLMLFAITALYVFAAEIAKKWFYARFTQPSS
jgi:P-type Mg2+ transporter